MIVKWDDIAAECGGFRAGLVAVFRKYEGRETDERTADGRVITVNPTSFARHMGIVKTTFGRWLTAGGESDMDRGKAGDPEYRAGMEGRMVANFGPARMVDAIMAAPPKTQDRIFDDLKLRRAGIDNSPAARKAAKARTAEQMEPFFKAVEHLEVHSVVIALKDATESLRKVLDGSPTSADMEQIVAAHDEFMVQLAEASYLIS